MTQAHFLKSAICMATITLVAACGGGSDSGNPANSRATESGVSIQDAPLIKGTTGDTIKIGSTLPFGKDNLPSVQIFELNDNGTIKTEDNPMSFTLGDVIAKGKIGTRLVDGKAQDIIISNTKRYLITLKASATQPYFSPTRASENENCLESNPPSGRICSAEAGRKETLQVTLSAISNFKAGVNVGPVSTLQVERVRFLMTPAGSENKPELSNLSGEAKLVKAIEIAAGEVRSLFVGNKAEGTDIQSEIAGIAGVQSNAISLLDDTPQSIAALSVGMLERLVQQMARTTEQRSAPAGYSAEYATLFASFARDGKFQSSLDNVDGGTLGLRSAGPLLNGALTEHLIKDLPRFPSSTIDNFTFQDFLGNSAAKAVRNSLASVFPDLYGANSGAVANVSYISKAADNKSKDHSITAVAARFGGVFFLDSRGEAQDGSKPAVRCPTSSFGLSNYEVTGVAPVEGATLPLVLAYSHTSTRAVLIDVRQAGLDNAASASELSCALKESSYRVIDFRDVGQNAALYQSASQYQHVRDGESSALPVTLTGASFNALTQRIQITTLDGTLSFDLIPSSSANNLSSQTRYAKVEPFVSAGSPGLSMNPAFDNSGLKFPNVQTSIWSPFDYSTNGATQNDLLGIYTFNTLPAPDKSEVLPRRGVIPQMGTLASEFAGSSKSKGLALTSGLDAASQRQGNEDVALFKTRNNCLDPAEPFKRYAPIEPFATVKFSRGDNIAEQSPSPFEATLPVPGCPANSQLSITQVADANDTYPGSTPTQRRVIYTCSGGGILGGTAPSPTYGRPTTSTGANNAVDMETELNATTGTVDADTELFGKCTIGFHGVAMSNRYGQNLAIDAIAVGAKNPFIFEQGLVKSIRVGSTAARAIGTDKPFVVLSPDRAKEKRQLVLDDVRSYNIIRQRGTFSKPLAYFLAKESNAGSTTYSLIEVDLDSVRNIPGADKPSGSYMVPTTAAESREIAGPVRVYFR